MSRREKQKGVNLKQQPCDGTEGLFFFFNCSFDSKRTVKEERSLLTTSNSASQGEHTGHTQL